jgi:hypothetical protein
VEKFVGTGTFPLTIGFVVYGLTKTVTSLVKVMLLVDSVNVAPIV